VSASAKNADVLGMEGKFSSWGGSETQSVVGPVDEWDGDAQFSSWGGSDARSVASTSRPAWDDNEDAQSVVSASSRAGSEWHISEGDPWAEQAPIARNSSNNGSQGAGKSGWVNKPAQRGRGGGPGQQRGGNPGYQRGGGSSYQRGGGSGQPRGGWANAGPAGRQQSGLQSAVQNFAPPSSNDDWGNVSNDVW
jgi:hypothetical protein